MQSWPRQPVERAGRNRNDERVSVVLATYNGARYLPAQLESLRHQIRWPDEVIVVDDSSTDDTVEITRRFARTAPFPVTVVGQPGHSGTCRTFGEGLRRASGDVILICDQDDVWMPEKVAVMAERMAEQPEALLAISDAVLIDAHDRRIGGSRWRVSGFGPAQRRAMATDPLGQLVARQVVSGCTAGIRSELVDAILPFPEDLHPALPTMMYDRWISLLAAAAAPIVVIEERLVEYRIHPEQQIGIPALPLRRLVPQTALRLGQFVPDRDERIGRYEYHVAHLHEIHKRLEHAGLDSGESTLRLRVASDHLEHRVRAARSRLPTAAMRHYLDQDGYRRFSVGAAAAASDWLS